MSNQIVDNLSFYEVVSYICPQFDQEYGRRLFAIPIDRFNIIEPKNHTLGTSKSGDQRIFSCFETLIREFLRTKIPKYLVGPLSMKNCFAWRDLKISLYAHVTDWLFKPPYQTKLSFGS